ncbi:MAG: hypothetical protein JXM73_16705 [Anaerolineae bacterium]|nr:hypothetical protein [Anaerolineae bacterium]
MTETDLQLGGGYTYQWECAILLALNYFFEPVRYNPTLDDLVTEFLGEVTEILLEGEDRERGVELEDITLAGGQRRILVQVKTKQAEGERWSLTDPLLLKVLYRFYDSRFLTEHPDDVRFVFLTNRPFNPDLVQIKDAIRAGRLDDCPEADRLYGYLDRYARAEKGTSLDLDRFHRTLARTALVEYLAVDAVKANVQAKLQAYGRADWREAHAVLFERFVRQSTRRGGGGVARASLAEVLGPPVPAGREAVPAPFTVPFPRSPDFVGRQEDLERLHQALTGETPVGIRPAGLTGMGGIGKTQLAVEYAYRYRDDYPGGVLWMNAAERLAPGFAALGRRLRPATVDQSQEEQIRAVAGYLQRHPDALLMLDNLADPAALNQPVASGVIPAALPCRALFTTRRRDLGRFTPVEVTVLPEGPALQLLLRHPDRQSIRARDHSEHEDARSICRLLGRLPLALEVAGAFLGEWPNVSLADFQARLRREGCLAALDEEARELPPASLPLIHDAAVAATLKTQWDALADPDACLLLRVAGQLPEAAQIPVARLGLLAGVPDDGRPGRPSRLARALKRLERASLVEALEQAQMRLHPLVRDFAAGRTAEAEARDFRRWCTANLAAAYEDAAVLQDHCARRGIDALEGDLLTALNLLPAESGAPGEEPRTEVRNLLRLVRHETHNLRPWSPGQRPGFFAQQVHYRAASLELARLAADAAAYLAAQGHPFLRRQWGTNRESPALERTLTGYEGWVNAVAVTPDGRRAVSASGDRTLRVWDLATGQAEAVLRGHEGPVSAVAVTPDGRRAVSGSWDRTLRVWDLATGKTAAVLHGHELSVDTVAVTPDGRRAVSGSPDSTLRVWDLATGKTAAILRGHEDRVRAVAVTPDGRRAVSGSADQTLRVWDLTTGEAAAVLRGHEDQVLAVAVTPDGRRAVSASGDGALRVWDLATGKTAAVLRGHERGVTAVAVTPDGRRAVSASQDRMLRVWDLA